MIIKEVTIRDKKHCDLCGKEAKYDSKTVIGSWGYLCEVCYHKFGVAPTTKLVYLEVSNGTNN